ncbi:hypothetical protein [Frigidibacter sp. MR17.24]|uniref:hypothetical protein n=1 Tax=Frigidibacter sp. MR17.24 TaxID=3127345 RepID=UPI003012DF90
MRAIQAYPQQRPDGPTLVDFPATGDPGPNLIRKGAAHVINDRLNTDRGERVRDPSGAGAEVGTPSTLAQSIRTARVGG